MDRTEILKKLKHFKDEKGSQYGIKRIGIFGSFAKNCAGPNSDVDVVIELDIPDMFIMVHIKEELEKILNTKVDIIRNRPKMNPYLQKHIEKEALYV